MASRRSPGPPAAAEGLRRKLLEAHERLYQLYQAPIPFVSAKDPLSELVSALLSHRTRNAASSQAYRTLRARFPTWEQVRDAPPDQIQAAITAATWPEQKAPRIQAVLREISRQRGGLSLDFLATVPEHEARAWLEALPGVGPKTSAAVLLFSQLRRRALPVDSHHLRVVTRLGVLPSRVDPERAHRLLEAMLPADWDAQTVYDHHEVLMLHGQRVCHQQAPLCGSCALLDQCAEGRKRLGLDVPTSRRGPVSKRGPASQPGPPRSLRGPSSLRGPTSQPPPASQRGPVSQRGPASQRGPTSQPPISLRGVPGPQAPASMRAPSNLHEGASMLGAQGPTSSPRPSMRGPSSKR